MSSYIEPFYDNKIFDMIVNSSSIDVAYDLQLLLKIEKA